ncbi:MAG: Hint domain-containing protein [Rubellimicrobium sp.]|nr:Hint domain-containing protein [Rubellimicrobium sp.]
MVPGHDSCEFARWPGPGLSPGAMVSETLSRRANRAKATRLAGINDQGEKVPINCRDRVEIRADFGCLMLLSPQSLTGSTSAGPMRTAGSGKDRTMFMQDAQAFSAAEKITIAAGGAGVGPAGHMTGMLALTQVETAAGWRAARTLLPGMRVQTFDGGLAIIRRVERHALSDTSEPVMHIPGGALSNCADLWLAGGQRLLLAGAPVEALFDCAAIQVRACALAGFRGIACAKAPVAGEIVSLGFDQDEAVFANTGSLLYFPAAQRAQAPFFPQPSEQALRLLLAAMDGGDAAHLSGWRAARAGGAPA